MDGYKGGGGSRQTVTNGEKGGGGVKNRDFYGDILFEWPLYGSPEYLTYIMDFSSEIEGKCLIGSFWFVNCLATHVFGKMRFHNPFHRSNIIGIMELIPP